MILKKANIKTANFISLGSFDLDDSELFRLITKYNDCNTAYYYLFDKILIWKSCPKKIKSNAYNHLEKKDIEKFCSKKTFEFPKVSVIIPAYNVEKYLERCLMSLIKQTLLEIEIIVIDDGSTDKTLEIAREFEKLDARIKVLSQTNQKQGAARNRGLEVAKGEFIGFVDADDWVDLDYFEKMYNAATKHNVNIAAANATRDYSSKVKIHLKLEQEQTFYGANDIVKAIKNNLVVHSKIFRFDRIKNLRFPEGVFYEDAPYAIRAIDMSNSLVTIPNTTYHYFSNQNSTIKQVVKGKNLEDKIKMNLDLINYCEENNVEIGNWEVLKERHLLWSIKHYKYFKTIYVLGIKVLTLKIPFDKTVL